MKPQTPITRAYEDRLLFGCALFCAVICAAICTVLIGLAGWLLS